MGLALGGILVVAAAAVGWLLRAEGTLTTAMIVHATLMLTAWGVLLPAGAVVARYFKVTPRQNFPAEVDNPFWWNWHRCLQYLGVALATVALGVIVSETGGRFDTWHGRCGLFVMLVAWIQLASPLFRGTRGGATDAGAVLADPTTWRGDHYDMTRRRKLFEAWHKRSGWAVIVLAGVTILLGIDLAGAPPWLFGVAGLLQSATIFGVIDGRVRRRWVDTYQALWGPDPTHPGNRLSAPPSRRPRPRSRR